MPGRNNYTLCWFSVACSPFSSPSMSSTPLSVDRAISLLLWLLRVATVFFLGRFPRLMVGRFFSQFVCHSLPVQLIPFLPNFLVEPANSCVVLRTLSPGILRARLTSPPYLHLLSKETHAWPARQLSVTQDEQVELKAATETHL